MRRGGDCPRPCAYPGGIGIAEKGFEMIAELWQATLKAVDTCPCTTVVVRRKWGVAVAAGEFFREALGFFLAARAN